APDRARGVVSNRERVRARGRDRRLIGAPFDLARLLGLADREGARVTAAPFSTIPEALDEIRRGRTVIVCDGEDRENEGDLVLAAQFATPEAINFMAKQGRGLICLALSAQRCSDLGLQPMTRRNEAMFGTAFTVSIEARDGVTTG